ncbi:hypothetical protein BCR37DRAFT_359433, partial [Protomyces lactucae-debilis]
MHSQSRLPRRLLSCSLHTLRQLLKEAPAPGSITHIQGWVLSVQHLKNKSFAMISDGSTHERVQAVLTPAQAAGLSYRTSVSLRGKLVLPRRAEAAIQKYDLEVESLELLGSSPKDIPLQNKYNSAEYLRQHAHFRPQTQVSASILRLQSKVLQSVTDYFSSQDYIQTLPPVLTSSDCEGAGETFQIQQGKAFFGKPTSLAVSSQLHLECLAMGLGRVWTLAPTFRAEKSTTSRHLAEFRMLEAELSFCELPDLLTVVEGIIRAAAKSHVDGKLAAALSLSTSRNPWPRIRYEEAIIILQDAVNAGKATFTHSTCMGSALQTEHEQYLAKHFGGPLFVTHYPMKQKPFYMQKEGDSAVCFDLLVPGMGELCGGSMREHNHHALLSSMRQQGISIDEMAWYADLRKYGTVPHGGFGIGFERLVGYLIGVTNVREVAAFPRWL